MTESQWLTSDNPAELVAFLGERITDEHRRYFVEACRKECDDECARRPGELLPVMWLPLEMASEALSIWLGDRWAREVPAALRAEILRDIVGNPFSGVMDRLFVLRPLGMAVPSHGLRPSPMLREWLTWNDGTIPKMVDAMMNEDCSKCNIIRRGERYVFAGPDSHWEPCTCDKGRIPRTEPRWADMPVIADALEEAGCRDQHILEHLRSERDGERCPWCPSEPDYPLNHSTDCCCGRKDCPSVYLTPCLHCSGTGRIKRRHWRGCHVVELLKGIS